MHVRRGLQGPDLVPQLCGGAEGAAQHRRGVQKGGRAHHGQFQDLADLTRSLSLDAWILSQHWAKALCCSSLVPLPQQLMHCGAPQNLEQINDHLKNSGTPYLGGERPNARALDLGPKFYHIKTAMKHYKVCACYRQCLLLSSMAPPAPSAVVCQPEQAQLQ